MATDSDLIQIVDSAMAEAVRRSGAWIACRPGCAECCIGPFPISLLDAGRLREGLAKLAQSDPDRAARVVARAQSLAGAMSDDDPCPVLDPVAQTCDLYVARPITCRIFGPAVRSGGNAAGVCELCYEGATEEEIAACVVDIDVNDLENEIGEGEAVGSVVDAILSGC